LSPKKYEHNVLVMFDNLQDCTIYCGAMALKCQQKWATCLVCLQFYLFTCLWHLP